MHLDFRCFIVQRFISCACFYWSVVNRFYDINCLPGWICHSFSLFIPQNSLASSLYSIYFWINPKKSTNYRWISLIWTNYWNSKLSKTCSLKNRSTTYFFNILENLQENQSPKITFWKYSAFPLNFLISHNLHFIFRGFCLSFKNSAFTLNK